MPGPVLWCLRGRDLFAPALARVGLHPDRVIYCETWKDRDVLPAMEEGLECNGLAGVVGEVDASFARPPRAACNSARAKPASRPSLFAAGATRRKKNMRRAERRRHALADRALSFAC